MKKLLTFICVICLFSVSCEKSEDICYFCITTATERSSTGQTIHEAETKVRICDITSPQVKEWEREHTYTVIEPNGYVTDYVTFCVKRELD
ncbi:MAG: hypothetical protein HN352_13780 [Bacteroidetes bacterium]|jgi:hypothetical protein|nr:hypothetical protein [Bacteroidota bacterium]MBT3748010.1 hypothetical protein [Bacteroidota bacterium]MBT4398941.1 hypothetical protein [Bacteroidota bacterium]MBT4411968.1 hypothetical protein [Bacteroidota bacterium]MBT5424667.1 hypothetical protein [Bacteroidota bacterium]